MEQPNRSTVTVAGLSRSGACADVDVATGIVDRHGGTVVPSETGRLEAEFASVPDAVAFAAALIDGTVVPAGSFAVGVGEATVASTLASAAETGQALASAAVESRTRGRLACGLSFRRVSDGGELGSLHQLLATGAPSSF